MYHKLVKILIVSDDAGLEKFVRAAEPLERFSHEVERIDPGSWAERTAGDYDVLIFDAPLDKVQEMVSGAGETAKLFLIYCDRTGGLDDPSAMALFDDIWPAPFTAGRVGFFLGRAQKVLRDRKDLWLSDHLFTVMLDSVPDLGWIKDKNGIHTKVNASFCKLVGKPKEDCEGKDHYSIWDVPTDEKSVCTESEAEVIAAKKTCTFDENIKGPGNRMLLFRTYKTPIYDEDGETLLATCGVATNVTDWNNIIREHRLVLDVLNMPVVITDESGVIRYASKAWEIAFGQTAEELVGKDYLDEKERLFELHSEKIAERSNTEFSHIYNNQVYDYILSEVMIRDTYGQHIGYFCVFKDITEHKTHLRMMEKFQKVLEQDVMLKSRTLVDIQQKIYVALANFIDIKDKQTGAELRYSSYIIRALLEEMTREKRFPELLDKEYSDAIINASLVHDIGMVMLSDRIVFKKGKYTDEERRIMKGHTLIGKKILDRSLAKLENFKAYKVAADMALYHHERFDGAGYPKGLKGKDIPFAARIMAIVDTFVALISPRSFRMTYTVDQAYSLMKSNAGAHFDTDIMAAFILARPNIERLVNEMIYKIDASE